MLFTSFPQVKFHLPATPIHGPHRDSLCRLCYLQDGSIVSCSQDGTICFWTPKMKQKRKRKVSKSLLDMSVCTLKHVCIGSHFTHVIIIIIIIYSICTCTLYVHCMYLYFNDDCVFSLFRPTLASWVSLNGYQTWHLLQLMEKSY